MTKLRKTMWLSEKTKSGRPEYRWQAPYIDFIRRKWRQDTMYFDDPMIARAKMKACGFLIR